MRFESSKGSLKLGKMSIPIVWDKFGWSKVLQSAVHLITWCLNQPFIHIVAQLIFRGTSKKDRDIAEKTILRVSSAGKLSWN